MYIYELEKNVGTNYLEALQQLSELIDNAQKVHQLLGRLFNVETEENWRKKYNILYRVETVGVYRLYIKSDKVIDKNRVEENGFKVVDEKKFDVKDGETVNIKLLFSPYRNKSTSTKREFIKTREEREQWLKYKLEDYTKACKVVDFKELESYNINMVHKEEKKGSVRLRGYNYELKLKVADKDAFMDLVTVGLGCEKAYGFGMLALV